MTHKPKQKLKDVFLFIVGIIGGCLIGMVILLILLFLFKLAYPPDQMFNPMYCAAEINCSGC